jgi:hypothetical protein
MFSGHKRCLQVTTSEKESPIMSQIKLAAILMMPILCSIAPAQESGKTLPQKAEVTDVSSPVDCTKIEYRAGEVYGPYVPYAGPALLPSCRTPNALALPGSTSQPNSSAAHPGLPQPETNSVGQPSLDLNALNGLNGPPHPPAPSLPLTTPSKPSDIEPPGGSSYVYVRPARTIPAPTMLPDLKPFRTFAFGVKADTLGLGFEIATPLALRINLRSSINIFAFSDPFSIDGVNYDSRLHLKSSETVLDFFPVRGFHISPGILYVKNTMSAPASVAPGQTFTLGSQTFLNSIDDPVSGSASVVYPHTFAPILLLGFGNIIPRSGRHISVPFEFGVAYTGAPQISVALNGTACTTDGCVSFTQSTQAQTYLKQEIYNLNEDLKRFPVFPIISLGLAYHF